MEGERCRYRLSTARGEGIWTPAREVQPAQNVPQARRGKWNGLLLALPFRGAQLLPARMRDNGDFPACPVSTREAIVFPIEQRANTSQWLDLSWICCNLEQTQARPQD